MRVPRQAVRSLLCVAGLAMSAFLDGIWLYVGLVVFVGSLLSLLGVGRTPVRKLARPEVGQAHDVLLLETGPRMIEVMKVVREYSGLSAEQVRLLFDAVPTEIGVELASADAASLVEAIDEVGGRAEIASHPGPA